MFGKFVIFINGVTLFVVDDIIPAVILLEFYFSGVTLVN